jgi:hypothetical protein
MQWVESPRGATHAGILGVDQSDEERCPAHRSRSDQPRGSLGTISVEVGRLALHDDSVFDALPATVVEQFRASADAVSDSWKLPPILLELVGLGAENSSVG